MLVLLLLLAFFLSLGIAVATGRTADSRDSEFDLGRVTERHSHDRVP